MIYSRAPFGRPTPVERLLVNVNLNLKVLISTHDERPPLLKGHFSDAKRMALHDGLHCILKKWNSSHSCF